tara:strand:+ start:409 stop:723 length:315 start_codon:yes stop_codon:yes gene_type:complete
MKSPNAIFYQRKNEKSYSVQWPKLLSTSAALKRCSYYKSDQRQRDTGYTSAALKRCSYYKVKLVGKEEWDYLSCPKKVQLLQGGKRLMRKFSTSAALKRCSYYK